MLEIIRKIYFIFFIFVDNIKMKVQEVGWGGVDWIKMAQDREK
jgi:hypothetical protein